MENNQFRGFDIISELGSGAFSKTMLAEQDGKHAVIKIIELPNEATIEKYSAKYTKSAEFTEAMRNTGTELHQLLKALTALPQSTGILRHYDYTLSLDSDKGIYTLAVLTQYETPLHAVLASGEVPVGAILRMGSQLCEGLETMLKKFVVHGNIKESNIFYNSKTGFSLGDFYINDILSTTLVPDRQFKSYGYRFLAPEAYTGEEYSFKTDIFSLGMMMYKIFNHNRLPYDDAPHTTLKKIKSSWDLARTLPLPAMNIPEITKVLAKATAYNKDERYASFMQLKNSLDRLLATLPKEILYTKIPAPGFDAQQETATEQTEKAEATLSPAEAAFHPTGVSQSAEAAAPKAAVSVAEAPAEQSTMRARSHVRKVPAAERPPEGKAPAEQATAAGAEAKPAGQQAIATEPAEAAKPKAPRTPTTEESDDAAAQPAEQAEDEKDEPPITPRKPADEARHPNRLIPSSTEEEEDDADRQNVRPLKHYEPPAGVTDADSIVPPPISLEATAKRKRRIRIPNEDFNYFDFNSEEFTDTSPRRKNTKLFIIALVVLGLSILAVTGGFIFKFLMQ